MSMSVSRPSYHRCTSGDYQLAHVASGGWPKTQKEAHQVVRLFLFFVWRHVRALTSTLLVCLGPEQLVVHLQCEIING